MFFKTLQNELVDHFEKNEATTNVYKTVYQVVTFKKRSMTAQPVTMAARKARCHRNTI